LTAQEVYDLRIREGKKSSAPETAEIRRAITMSEQNKAASGAAFEVWSNGDLDRLDAFIAVDVIHHDPYDPYRADGLAGMKKLIRKNRNLYPDLRILIEDQIAEGDKVATRWIASMTHNGKQVTLRGITIDRFEKGKIVEAWRNMDMLGLRQQTGAVAVANE
jgi:predicted ester cyclase